MYNAVVKWVNMGGDYKERTLGPTDAEENSGQRASGVEMLNGARSVAAS